MKKKSLEIEGIKYVLGEYNWGVETEISSKIVGYDYDMVGRKVKPIIDSGKYQRLVVVYSLREWTFRGYDDEGKLKQEGDILKIDEETVKLLPRSHGDQLLNLAREINGIGEAELKNLLGQLPPK